MHPILTKLHLKCVEFSCAPFPEFSPGYSPQRWPYLGKIDVLTLFTAQMANRGKSVRFGSCRLGFDYESDQTNNFKIGIHSFRA